MLKRIFKIQNIGLLLSAILFFSLSACSEDNGEEETPPEPSIEFSFTNIFDLGNEQNGGDIYVRMTVSNFTSTSVRFAIVTSQASSSISPEQVLNLDEGSYAELNKNGIIVRGKLTSIENTIDGTPLANNTQYRLIAYSIEENFVSAPSETFIIKDTGVLAGDYVGTWNDNIYTDFPISVRISGFDGAYGGSFFYSNNYASCCGGQTDGNINFAVEDGIISNFTYDQDLITYKNGCPGFYEGSGELEDELNLLINFTGDDCDGHHSGGVIKLRRVN